VPFLNDQEMAAERVSDNMFRKIIYTDNLMMVIVMFENGPWDAGMPLHNHPHEQCSYLAEGQVEFTIEGEGTFVLNPGDAVSVPPNIMHTVKLKSEKAKLIDTFSPIRKDFLE